MSANQELAQMANNNNSVDQYAIQTPDGVSIHQRPCLQSLKTDMAGKDVKAFAYLVFEAQHTRFMRYHPISYDKNRGVDIREYRKWIFETSPYQSAVRNYECYNVVDMDIEGDERLVCQAIVALRCSQEYVSIPLHWATLVNHGANPDVALIVAHMINTPPAQTYFTLTGDLYGCHVPLDPDRMAVEGASNFCKHIQPLKTKAFKHFTSYEGHTDMWNNKVKVRDSGESIAYKIRMEFKEGEVMESKSISGVETSTFTIPKEEKYIQKLADYCNKLSKELLAL